VVMNSHDLEHCDNGQVGGGGGGGEKFKKRS